MSYGMNTAGNIAAFVNTVYDECRFVARENNLMSNLVTVFSDQSGTALRKNAYYGTATLSQIGDDDDLTSQVFSPTVESTLTPYEFGAQFFITDLRLETDPYGVRNDASQELGQALAESIDVAVCGDFNSLTGGTIGTSGSVMTWNYFFAMLAALRAKHAPMPYVFVCHPNQWYRLGKAASIGSTVTNQPSVQDAFARNFYVQTVAGVDCYTSSNCEASSTDNYAAMFSRSALALDMRRAPRLEVERDASRRGYELNISAVYAHGVWRPNWGVQGIFAGSAPDGTS
jgi:hypothetical protein